MIFFLTLFLFFVVSKISAHYTSSSNLSVSTSIWRLKVQEFKPLRGSVSVNNDEVKDSHDGFLTVSFYNGNSCSGKIVELYATTLGRCSLSGDGHGVKHYISSTTGHLYQELYQADESCSGERPLVKFVPLTEHDCVQIHDRDSSYLMEIISAETQYHHGIMLQGSSSTSCICVPTAAPTAEPTSASPSAAPTSASPSFAPTSASPSLTPTNQPSRPTFNPSFVPSSAPVIPWPSLKPTPQPTYAPVSSTPTAPTFVPTYSPTDSCPRTCDT